MSTFSLPHTSSKAFPPASLHKDSHKEPDNSDLINEEEQFTSGWAKALFGKRTGPDPDAIATRRSVFDDPYLAPYYWPTRDYENIHRFDPSVRWTHREEKALLRKTDWKIMFMAAVSFSALNLDRGNLGLANSASFLSDLHLTTNDFNMGNTIFRLAFLFAELPSQLISKRIGPDRWIPTQICLWSIVSLGQFWLTGKASFFACRGLLGFIPDLILYMSYFYTKTELPIRLAGFWMSLNICAIAGSFLAYGILHLSGVAGKAGWRQVIPVHYDNVVDRLITLAIGIASFFNMPPSPTQTRTWFRPKGWFTEREEFIIVNKVLRDDPTKGDMHNREGLSPKRLWTAICDYDLWPVYILGLTFGMPSSTPSTYLTLLLRQAGRVKALCSHRSAAELMLNYQHNLWALPFLVAVYTLPSTPTPWLFFGLLTGLLSYPYVGWCSRNSGAVASRTVNASLYNMFAQASIIAATQIYVASDAPRYERGNRILISICLVNVLLLYPGTKAYYIWRNRQRAKKWDAMVPEASLWDSDRLMAETGLTLDRLQEKAHYLKTTKDVGNRRLDFRFAH
ncbi:allantoate permease [Lanmaoa asiatica]|nr:allantoate permease [Lanmaoa asiatica]